jgi:hypothetical protein
MSTSSGSPQAKRTGKGAEDKPVRKTRDVNLALRRAYDSAVDETIPQTMLDLLDKLS